ncbi:alpha/beta hydrolase [Aliiroseovarius sp. F47248L]|uniref:alpha/beta fold hydrolase n=1 Tax=Aliiroseovarius sp. F47248L TaxID=2926420 RepID=UPI001FF563FD|nr:alpha/beta hydrolase [Aliiroseovarius sp. F47248L]MCK0138602.1 alpha/beta hydrolase [Aliiroseovarius sp. F47248L]
MSDAPLFNDIAQGPPSGCAFWRTASDGVRVRLAHWPRQDGSLKRGTVLLFPGRTEYIEKYGLTASELAERGFDTLTIDWRGQGLSDRPDNERALGHVGHFDEYQLDLAQMMALAEELDLPRPFTMLAHSMGGCIGLRALHNGLDVAGACFSAPMWGIVMSKPVRPLAWGFSWALHRSPWKLALSPGTARQTYVLAEAFEGNMLTTDPQMWDMMRNQAKAHPELTLGGPTAGWLFAALSEMRELANMAAPNVPAVTWLGTNERIVEPAPVHALMARWPNGRLEILQGLEHEVIMEAPDVRKQVYTSIEDLAQGRSASSAA